ncbi:hypothetical protein [Pontibacillus yanchengensis]|uniref:Lipoprotein n=1 Tax=Pontibacillus yanchengensis Y32 TaxID=1385514 RepID=A0A0A2TJR5_9BACI|nr:hypothetical protein [Pontibacillus yanchengensis]KGP74683.1 hypothetical protein N782_00485 [Pontibacillus yanchengensis Y32]
MKKVIPLLLLIFIAACDESTPKESKITIEPTELTDEEKNLLPHTGLKKNSIHFFGVSGNLTPEEQLVMKIIKYKNGNRSKDNGSAMIQDEFLSNWARTSISYKTNSDTIEFSFGSDKGRFTLPYNIPEKISHMFPSLLQESQTLTTGDSIYLGYWRGTTDNRIEVTGGTPTSIPDEVKESDLAFVFEVEVVPKES